MNLTAVSIGTKIKTFRLNANKTLKEVSEGTGLSISLLSDIERGRTNPSLETCNKLAKFYNVTLSWFFFGI